MRGLKLLGAGAALAMGAGLLAAGPASAVSGTEYVALGDSYSSGVGTNDYDPSSGDCKRSPAAYPSLWNAANKPASFSFVACSGAKTSDVNAKQISALKSSTSLVSITIGGNDAGFTNVMTSCITGGDGGCNTAVNNAINYVQNTLPGNLDGTYAKIKAAAPSAHVVVLGYPHFYQLGGSCKVGLSDTSRGYINHGADVLDDTIAARAKAAGFTFADVRGVFTGHEICSSDWWLNSLNITNVTESYHPTKDGQSKGYLPTFSSGTGADAGTESVLSGRS